MQTTHEDIDKIIQEKLFKFKADYEKQKITDKNGNVKRRSWQKKMTPFTEIILSFGTQRKKGKRRVKQGGVRFYQCFRYFFSYKQIYK